MQVERKWCGRFKKGQPQAQILNDLHLLGRSTTPLLIVYAMTFCASYIQMTFFPRSPKIGTFVIPKLWTFISSSNQTCLKHVRAIL
jgi:hypothetical protein